MSESASPSTPAPLAVACSASPAFQEWIARAGGAVAVSTYQAGKVAMIGWDGRQVTLLMREFDKPLGLGVSGQRLVLATRHDVSVFANAPLLAHEYLEHQPGRYDALYLPRATYHTGDLHTHDVALLGDEIWLAATRFSCLAKLSYDFNFLPVWKPPFVTRSGAGGSLPSERHCGARRPAALRDRPGNHRRGGGLARTKGHRRRADRRRDQRDRARRPGHAAFAALARRAALGCSTPARASCLLVDPAERPGRGGLPLAGLFARAVFLRPVCRWWDCRKIRERHIFGGLPVQQRGEPLLCGVAVVDLRSGRQAGFFEFTAGCEELYDVQFLPGVFRPMILNLEKPEVRQAMTNPDSSYWLRPSSEIREPETAGTSACHADGKPVPPEKNTTSGQRSFFARNDTLCHGCEKPTARHPGEALGADVESTWRAASGASRSAASPGV